MGLATLNIWVSDVGDPCGTSPESGMITILDCRGILKWPCGRYLSPNDQWEPIPDGQYLLLPYKCGHLEVELPPGCYWVFAGGISVSPTNIHPNNATHVGIVEVGCDETACVKIFNPTARLCWDWAVLGLRTLAATGQVRIDYEQLEQLVNLGEEVLRDLPRRSTERLIEEVFTDLVKSVGKQQTS